MFLRSANFALLTALLWHTRHRGLPNQATQRSFYLRFAQLSGVNAFLPPLITREICPFTPGRLTRVSGKCRYWRAQLLLLVPLHVPLHALLQAHITVQF